MLQAAEPPVTPIIFDILHGSSSSVRIGGLVKSFPEAELWLQETSSKFGRTDPIVIRLESNEDIYVAAVFARLALKTHDKVYIALPKPDKADQKFYLLPIASSEAAFSIQTASTVPTSTLQLGDHFPDSARDRLINNFEKVQRGEIR
jgi:hypothetical protein